jgi:hypothetical protein
MSTATDPNQNFSFIRILLCFPSCPEVKFFCVMISYVNGINTSDRSYWHNFLLKSLGLIPVKVAPGGCFPTLIRIFRAVGSTFCKAGIRIKIVRQYAKMYGEYLIHPLRKRSYVKKKHVPMFVNW